MKTFFILCLPRSRSAWLANFLSYGNSHCFHEGLVGCENVQDLRENMEFTGYEVVGNSDCGNILFIDEIIKEFDDAKFVVVHRNAKDVYDELDSIGLPEHGLVQLAEQKLKEFDVSAMHVDFNMTTEDASALWEFCTGTKCNKDRLEMLDRMDISVPVEKQIQRINQNILN